MYHSGPLISCALVSGILSFLSSSVNSGEMANDCTSVEDDKNNGTDADSISLISNRTKEVFIISVGVISFLQIALQKIQQSFNYVGRSEMHHEAIRCLNRLEIEVRMDLRKYKYELLQNEEYDKISEKHKALLDQCVATCSSPIPLEIDQTFALLKNEIESLPRVSEKYQNSPLWIWHWFAMAALFAEISEGWFWWKVRTPSPAKTVKEVCKTVLGDLDKSLKKETGAENGEEGNKGSTSISKEDLKIDDKSNYEIDPILDFRQEVLTLRLQHRLAEEYFRFLEGFIHSFPLIVVAFISGILSFLSSSGDFAPKVGNETDFNITESVDNSTDIPNPLSTFISERDREILIVTVGVLSFVHITIQKVGQSLKYGSRCDMHREAEKNLSKLFIEIEFLQQKKGLGNADEKYFEEQLDTFRALYDQSLGSCTSVLPLEIEQAFMLTIDSIFVFVIMEKEKGFGEYFYWTEWACHEVCTEISKGCGFVWKLLLPSPKTVAKKVMDKLKTKLGEGESENNQASNDPTPVVQRPRETAVLVLNKEKVYREVQKEEV